MLIKQYTEYYEKYYMLLFSKMRQKSNNWSVLYSSLFHAIVITLKVYPSDITLFPYDVIVK